VDKSRKLNGTGNFREDRDPESSVLERGDGVQRETIGWGHAKETFNWTLTHLTNEAEALC